MHQTPDHAWAAQRVAPFPTRWQGRMLGAWHRGRNQRKSSHWTAEQEAHREANMGLLRITEQLGGHRIPLDAGDREICDRAEHMADRCTRLAELFHDRESLHAAMVRACKGYGIEPPKPKDCKDVMPSIRRMSDPLWWRRQLRKLHAKNVEGAAIRLGLVNRKRDPYVSNESLNRRQQQNKRNADTLESTIARNELGQEYTLAELAAKGTANKAVRRAELMTRISGFERIARALGHAGLFFTITCPSRMHKWRTVKGGAVIENPRYDGTTPREAQAYLAKVWARIRAALKRRGLGIYGFRIAEPNHDGTPHWHLLVFHVCDRLGELRSVVAHYAIADSPDEPGAHKHRVDFKPIDWERGTAAGYIAKYVAKNIDGYKVEKDLLGNDALETSARVEAWAATWGIRQFQQVGGPPVTVWRELRRVESVPDTAPAHLKQAHRAVNKVAVIEGRDNASVAWDHYCQAQGGVFMGRDYRIRLTKQDREGLNRYGEPLAPVTVGVETVGLEPYLIGKLQGEREVFVQIESTRYQWEIVTRSSAGRLVSKELVRVPDFAGVAPGPSGLSQGRGEASPPWTRVNNCTEGGRNAGKNRPPSGGYQGAGLLENRTSTHQGNGGGLCGTAVGCAGSHQRGA